MGIKFNCPDCNEALNIKAKLAGRRGFCPKCRAKIQIPGTPEPAVVENVQIAEDSPAPDVFEPSTASMSNPIGNSPAVPAAEPVAAIPVASELPPVAAAPVSQDPFDEAPNAVWYIRPPGGGQFGPASTELMKQWFAEGRVGANSLVWRDGWADWLVASHVFRETTTADDSHTSAAGNSGVGITTNSQVNPGTADQRKISYYRSKKRKATMAITIITIGVVIILALIVLLIIILSQQ